MSSSTINPVTLLKPVDSALKPSNRGTAAFAPPSSQAIFQQILQSPTTSDQASSQDTTDQERHSDSDERPTGASAAANGIFTLPTRVEFAPAPPLSPIIQEQLVQHIERLLIAPTTSQQAELHLLVRQELLPGVSIRLQEAEGRVLVCFSCAVEPVRRQLDRHAERLAQTLANRLHRDVLLQVQTDDPSDLRLYESLAQPIKA